MAFEKIFGAHASNLGQAMTLTSKRQNLLMQNLSNVNTPGYKRQDSDFHLQLQTAMDMPGFKARGVNFKNEGAIRLDGNNVDMECEVVSIAETEARYNALTEMTSRYFTGLKSVIKEGR